MMPASETDSLEADAVLYGRLTPSLSSGAIYHDQELLQEAEQRLGQLDRDARRFLQELVSQKQPMTFTQLDELINGPRNKNSHGRPSDALIWQDIVGPILKKLILTGMVSNYDNGPHSYSRWTPTPRGQAAAYLLMD